MANFTRSTKGHALDNYELLKFIFDRPDDGVEWYFQDDYEDLDLGNSKIVSFCGWLFSEIKGIHESFSEKQLSMGFNYLINSSCSSTCYSFLDQSVPLEDRLLAIHGMLNVFRDVFACRCKPTVMHATQATSGRTNLNYICYMWWDIFPRHGVPYSSHLAPIDDAIISVLRQTLEIDHLACKEAGLHGLGHWYSARPDEIEAIVQQAISALPESLVSYGLDAAKGKIQ